MNIISIRYKYKEEDDGWMHCKEDTSFDELEPEKLLRYANIAVKEILEEYPDAIITEICIW